MSPLFISSMCHQTTQPKDTWHHVFPSAAMIAPSIAFMEVCLWRFSDQGLVWVSIRAAGRCIPCLPEAFTPLTPLLCHMYSPCAAILKNASRLQLEIYNKTQEGPCEEKAGVDEQQQQGQRAKRREIWEKQNERDRDEDRGREKWGRPKACGVHHHFAWLGCD